MAGKPSNITKRGRKAVQRPNKTILRRTLVLMSVCGVAAFAVLAVKLYQVQIVKHDYYERLAVEQQTRDSTVTASRGTIYDTNGNVLAMSASVETVFISPYGLGPRGYQALQVQKRPSRAGFETLLSIRHAGLPRARLRGERQHRPRGA